MNTKFLGSRKPTKEEQKKGAEVVFLREDTNGKIIEVYGSKCYESFEQWGAPLEVLQDNCKNIEAWRRKQRN